MSSEAVESNVPPADPSIAGYAASDGPTEDDTLGFKPYVEALASLLTDKKTKPPITISIEGEWGSGKSSFLLQLEAAILQVSPKDAPKPLTVRFNAWRHDKQDQLWAAFALAFIASLRKEIGWRRALRGDWLVLWKRLSWKRFSKSDDAPKVLVYALCAVSFFVIIVFAFLSRLPLRDLFHLLCWLWRAKSASQLPPTLMRHLALDGPWAIVLSTAIIGGWKAWKSFRLPISLNLKKYLADPGYEGHTAFIETFHQDLQRLIEAYAGASRVYILIDDLDRCDVPKAAELMQAINLMIGDNQNLVFILGMDREKVAAGVALKYKGLLPFLRETAGWKAGKDPNDYSPVAFGYAYLEKFIQLSFTLPIPNTEAVLNRFLAPKPAPFSKDNAPVQPAAIAAGQAARPNLTAVSETHPAGGTSQPAAAPSSAPAVQYNRVALHEDDDRTRDIIRMTAHLFDYNPRRLKQFTNTFRLAIFIIANKLGLFDVTMAPGQSAADTRPTHEQVGKCVALLLHFPALRIALEQNPVLLAELEKQAITLSTQRLTQPDTKPDVRYAQWLNQRGALDLLTYHLGFDGFTGDQISYSLASFKTDCLFTILPAAQAPPGAPAAPTSANPATPLAVDRLAAMAEEYESIRERLPPSDERTRQMLELFERARAHASGAYRGMSYQDSTYFGRLHQQPGARIMFLALAEAFVDLRNIPPLLEMFKKYESWFEHCRCLEVMIDYSGAMLPGYALEIRQTLELEWKDISQDPPRLALANALRSAVEAALDESDLASTQASEVTRTSYRKSSQSKSRRKASVK